MRCTVHLTALDTNVLVRFFFDDDLVQHEIAKSLFATFTRERPAFISQPVLVETLWVLGRTYKLSKRECLDVLWMLIQSDEIEFDDGECVVEAMYAAEDGADFVDALINANARQFQADRCVTFDRVAAQKLGWTLLE